MKTRNLAIAIALGGLIVTGVLIAQSTTETADDRDGIRMGHDKPERLRNRRVQRRAGIDIECR